MKFEITMKFVDESGQEVTNPLVVDTPVPDFDDFHDANDFLSVFDQLEKAGLKLRDQSFAAALSQYLEELSKKKLFGYKKVKKNSSYIIESEAGKLSLHLFACVQNHKPDSVFPILCKNQHLLSLSYQELSMQMCSITSYRNAVAILNRMIRRGTQDSISLRTLSDFIVKAGEEIAAYQETFAEQVLEEHGFDPEHVVPNSPPRNEIARPQTKEIPQSRVEKAVTACNRTRTEQEKVEPIRLQMRLEEPCQTTYVSIDEIGVTRQKDSRTKESARDTKYVENTVVQITHGIGKYVFAGVEMKRVMKTLLAFLLFHDLLVDKDLVFFTDGARNLRNSIETLFAFRPYTIILDWYHLEKKCREYLSSALRGKAIRDQILEKVLSYLWVGNTEMATVFLLGLGEDKVRNRDWLENLVKYLDRNYSYIPCYALRKELGLKNSSNLVEKANDMVVAQRQKHNGMSWSRKGSAALSHIRAVYLNGEQEAWNQTKSLRFCMFETEICA